MPEKKLDLLQLATVNVTEFRACPSQIVWRYVIQFPHSRVYKCFVATTVNQQGEGNDKFDTGYPFVATIFNRTRKLAWCKENPQPGEKTKGHGLARVVMSPVCAGKLSALL